MPEPHLRHGHAISIDMAYSATLANMRGSLSDAEHRRLLNLFSKAGLSMDHEQFNEEVLEKATKAIMKTRDGRLRAAVPSPLGSCVFLNDVPQTELFAALKLHKKFMKQYPRNGEGIEAYVDASDTGYTELGQVAEAMNDHSSGWQNVKILNDDVHADNGVIGTNGSTIDSVAQPKSPEAAVKHRGIPNGIDGTNSANDIGGVDGVDGTTNGVYKFPTTDGVRV